VVVDESADVVDQDGKRGEAGKTGDGADEAGQLHGGHAAVGTLLEGLPYDSIPPGGI
jgi:hypothetical protein